MWIPIIAIFSESAVWWPELKKQLDSLAEFTEKAAPKGKPLAGDNEILEEILDLVRTQHKLLNDPETLLPPRYVAALIDMSGGRANRSPAQIHELREVLAHLRQLHSVLRQMLNEILEKHRPTINREEQAKLKSVLDSMDVLSREMVQLVSSSM